MAKTLNKDQIALLDKEVAKLDKKLSNKDMEKAMGMLMKKVGIQESDLDELSLSMKNMTKSGINKNVGVDKDKLRMSLKDLRKKLDKKKDESNIVRSKKSVAALRRKSAEENPKIRKEAQLDEVPIIPVALGVAGAAAKVYSRAKPLIDPLIKRGVDKAVPAIRKGFDAVKNKIRPSTTGSIAKPTQTTRGFKPTNIAKPKPKIINTPSRPTTDRGFKPTNTSKPKPNIISTPSRPTSQRGFKPTNIAPKDKPKIIKTPSRPTSQRGFKPANIAKPKNTKPPTQRSGLGNKAMGGPDMPSAGGKKGLSTLAKVGLGVGAAVAGKKTYDAMRNRAKEREAEMKRKQAEYQQRRRNDA